MSSRLKDYRDSYREWKQHPVEYKYPGERHRCSCCGEEHEGNYCPLCGQKASHGPVTWKSVWAGIMELWGLHSRSLPYTAWQLLFRPGHLMRDYVTGKRQVSFPPVKMLVLMGVIVYLLGQWVSPEEYTHKVDNITSTGVFYYTSYLFKWLLTHIAWGFMVVFSALILPTWIVFRHAPLLKHHTLPQGFFIQVFIANQSLFLKLIVMLLALMFFVPYSNLKFLLGVFLFIYLFVDYKQLFGYNWWGTLWRMLMLLVIIVLILSEVGGVMGLINNENNSSTMNRVIGLIVSIFTMGWITYLVIYFTDVINRKAWLERGKWAVVKWQVLITTFMVLFLGVVLVIGLMG